MSNQQRLRARLLEFLKFRVLAAQEEFVTPWQTNEGIDSTRFRLWLCEVWPEAMALDDDQLKQVLDQARWLYLT